MKEPLRWTITPKRQIATVVIQGDVGNVAYGEVVEGVPDNLRKYPGTRLVIVDIDRVTADDSMVIIGMLVSLCNRIQTLGRLFALPVRIVTGSERLRKYFKMTRMDVVYPVFATMEEALAYDVKSRQASRLPVMSDLFVIKGIQELRSKDPVSDLRSEVISSPARFSSLGIMDRKLGALLKRWGFQDDGWCDNVCIAVTELLSNIVQHGPKGPRGGAFGRMEVLCLKWSGVRYDYFFGYISHSNGQPIPLDQLHPRLRGTKAARGRGTQIVRALMDLFVIMKGTDGIVVMKKERHVAAS